MRAIVYVIAISVGSESSDYENCESYLKAAATVIVIYMCLVSMKY